MKCIDTTDPGKCSGCMACRSACPKDAISAREDANGFVYPQVDSSRCISCGLCVRACGFVELPELHHPLNVFSVVHRRSEALWQSTSGGAFSALSDAVLRRGGVIAGAVLERDMTIRHVFAETPEERDRMRGSLYVQSDTGLICREVREKLDAGRLVMFVGTPCQTGGLLKCLGWTRDNLLTVDILCHGTPNAALFREHARFLEERYGKGKKAVSYSFRSKKYGWFNSLEEIVFEDGRARAPYAAQAFTAYFYQNLSLRPSCHECAYRKKERPGDLTIADFWGIEKLAGKKPVSGVSMALINTPKGRRFFDEATEFAYVREFPYEKVEYRFPTSISRPKSSVEKFWALFHEKGYPALVRRYQPQSLKAKLTFALKKIAKKWTARLVRLAGRKPCSELAQNLE